MRILLEEYKANLEQYTQIALIMDVKIENENQIVTWILSSPKMGFLTEKPSPLTESIHKLQLGGIA